MIILRENVKLNLISHLWFLKREIYENAIFVDLWKSVCIARAEKKKRKTSTKPNKRNETHSSCAWIYVSLYVFRTIQHKDITVYVSVIYYCALRNYERQHDPQSKRSEWSRCMRSIESISVLVLSSVGCEWVNGFTQTVLNKNDENVKGNRTTTKWGNASNNETKKKPTNNKNWKSVLDVSAHLWQPQPSVHGAKSERQTERAQKGAHESH